MLWKTLTFGSILGALFITKSFASCNLISGDLKEITTVDFQSLQTIALKYSTKVSGKEKPGYVSFGIAQSKDESARSLGLAHQVSTSRAGGNMVSITRVNQLLGTQVIEQCAIKSSSGILYSVTGIFYPLTGK